MSVEESPRSMPASARISVIARWLIALLAWPSCAAAILGDEPEPLRVRLEVARGPYYAGQGIDLSVAVLAGDQRPTLELPRPPRAEFWTVETSFQPVSATGIGDLISGANLFRTRLRLVAGRAGVIEVPPITARLDGRVGRSRALRLSIEPVPLEGRPAGFLGGVGDFSIRSIVEPSSLAVGQELLYGLEITGPAAWGMSLRPGVDRITSLAIAPEVRPLADRESREPPTRTFLWRIRPTRPGDAVLPPVTVSAFDPATGRFLTKASRGLPVRVVAVPSLDPGLIAYGSDEGSRSRRVATWLGASLLLSLLVVSACVGAVLRRTRSGPRSGPAAARAFARGRSRRATAETEGELARGILADLTEYARLGIGRPAGALTPADAASTVRRISGSGKLAERASILCERCDRVLFSQRPVEGAAALAGEAGELFAALGESALSTRPDGLSATSRTNG